MKSRLDALLRQRELLREHAQWLEDEIAVERAHTGVPVPPSTGPIPPPRTQTHLPSREITLVEIPEPDVKVLHNEVRRGCLLYFLLATAAFGGLIAFIYWRYDPKTDETLPPASPPALTPDPGPHDPPRLH